MGLSRRWLLALSMVASLLVATPAASAPTHFDIDFTLEGGTPLPSAGGFDYDPAIPAFSNFIVEWAGITWDLTFGANHAQEGQGSAFSTSCGVTGPPLAFAFLVRASCITSIISVAENIFWVGFTEPGEPSVLSFGAFADDGTQLPVITTQLIIGADITFAIGDWSVTSAEVSEPPTALLITACLTVLAGVAHRRHRSHQRAARRPA
jgi:hypothetical protein